MERDKNKSALKNPTNKSISSNFLSLEKINKYVLPQYDLFDSDISLIKYKNTDKERAIYKVYNNNHYYSLKKVYYSEDNLLFIYSALEWLYRYNISVPRFLKTNSHSRFAIYDNMLFVLTPWLKGEKCNFDNYEDIINSITTLAKLHNAGSNFKPIYGSKIITGYTNQYIQTLKHFEELNRISTLAYNSKDHFSKCFINNFDSILFLSEISLKTSSTINIKELSKSLNHGDYVNKNILIDKSSVSIIDFDKCRYDYTAHDISYFLRRLLKRTNTKWNTSLCLTLLKCYNNINPLSKSDLKYIISYICFPQKCYKLSKDYYPKNNYYSKKSSLISDSKRNKDLSKKSLEKILENYYKLTPYQIEFAKEITKYFENTNWII